METVPFKNSSSDSVQTIAAHGIQADLRLLSHLQNGVPTSALTDGEQAHLRETFDHYISEHPLGFLAASSPIIAQSMLHDAAKRDAIKLMGAYNFASGNCAAATQQIDTLNQRTTEDLLTATPIIFSTIHRDMLVKAMHDLHHMADSSDGKLWGTSSHDEHEMHQQFQESTRQLEVAIALFDNGNTEAAMAKYGEVVHDSQGHIDWFQRAYRSSEKTKFAAHIGVTMAAGATAYFTGGASLALLGGAEAGVVAEATSLLVSGTSMTFATRGLDHVVFGTSVLGHGTATDRALDLSGDVLRNTFMMGWMRLAGIAGAALPVAEGNSVLASSLNTAQNITFEVGSLTGFNMAASTANLIDDHYPSLEQSVSKEGMMSTLAFVLGARIGTAGVRSAVTSTKIVANYLQDTQFFTPSETAVAGYPLLMLMPISRPPMAADTSAIPEPILAARARQSNGIRPLAQAIDFVTTLMTHTPAAKDQPIGFELEFDGKGKVRDTISQMMASALDACGLSVAFQRGTPNFLFSHPTIRFGTILYYEGVQNGTPVSIKSFRAKNVTQVSIVRSVDDATTYTFSEESPDLTPLLDAPPRLSRMIIMAKDGLDDTIQFNVALSGDHIATVHPLNAATHPFDIPLTSKNDTVTEVRTGIERFLIEGIHPKINLIGGLQVAGINVGPFKMLDEEVPYYEMVSPKMTVGTVAHAEPVIQALQSSDVDGTRASKLVGMHVHGEVSLTQDGRFSIAPALELMRAYVQHQHEILAIFPSHPNRSAYIQPYSNDYVTKLLDPNYVTDPTDPQQIAKVIADYNTHTPVKYSGLNMDNIFAVMVNRMGLDVTLSRTSPDKPTAELRIFDAIIDPASVSYIARFWGTFVHHFANRTMP